MTAASVTEVGDRLLLRVLADNINAGKARATTQAAELVPLVAAVPAAHSLFDAYTTALAAGDTDEAQRLLDQLTAGA